MPKTSPDSRRSRLAGGLADLRRLRKRHRSQHPASHPPSRRGSHSSRAAPVSDQALFRQAMSNVKPLSLTKRRHPQPGAASTPLPSAPLETFRRRRANAIGEHLAPAHPHLSDGSQAAAIQDDHATTYVRFGHDPRLARNLRRGKRPIDAWLDLHGHDIDSARAQLDAFINTCLDQHWRCVHIVHGKGYGSRNSQPVLKQAVRRWLTQYDAILAYCECTERHGGAGAVLALLRKPHKNG